MKKMNLILAACLYVVSLNAQLTSVTKTPQMTDFTAGANAELKVTKMERPQKQLNRITLGETIAQISVEKQKKKIVISVINVNPQIHFKIEDETGEELIVDKITNNSVKTYNTSQLPDGVYSLTLSGSGLEVKRYFVVTDDQVSLQDRTGFVTQIYQ